MCGLTVLEVSSLLKYEPETGVFRWKTRPANRVRVGDRAGSLNGEGYRYIKIHGRSMKANRLAWLITFGEWPAGQVDHIDGNKSNDSIDNLRVCTNAENCQNRSRVQGAYKTQKGPGYFSVVTVKGNRHYLGRFPTEELARAAYVEAKAKLHPFQNIENITR